MTSNTTKYQREFQREYRKTHPQKQYKKKKVKKEVKMEVKKVKVFDLHPPIGAVKVENAVRAEEGSLVSEVPQRKMILTKQRELTASKTIDFSYLANNSSFQRAIIEFIKRFVPGFENVKHRGSKEVMRKSFDQNANNYRNVMKELKEVLKKRNDG